MLRCLQLTLSIPSMLMCLALTGCETTMTEQEAADFHREPPSEMATEPSIERDIGIDRPQS